MTPVRNCTSSVSCVPAVAKPVGVQMTPGSTHFVPQSAHNGCPSPPLPCTQGLARQLPAPPPCASPPAPRTSPIELVPPAPPPDRVPTRLPRSPPPRPAPAPEVVPVPPAAAQPTLASELPPAPFSLAAGYTSAPCPFRRGCSRDKQRSEAETPLDQQVHPPRSVSQSDRVVTEVPDGGKVLVEHKLTQYMYNRATHC